jgi:hypothetical protein
MFRLALVVGAMFATVIAQPAAAQQPACTKRADVVNHLANKYSEKPVALGLANNGGVIEVLSSGTGESWTSWTIIITMPNGTACMIAAGENWEAVPKLATLEPSA